MDYLLTLEHSTLSFDLAQGYALYALAGNGSWNCCGILFICNLCQKALNYKLPQKSIPAKIYLFKARHLLVQVWNMFKANNKNTRTMSVTNDVDIFFVNFQRISHLFLVFRMLALNKLYTDWFCWPHFLFIFTKEAPSCVFDRIQSTFSKKVI